MIKSDSEFLQRAMKAYDNIQCSSMDELKEDLNRFNTIKKMLKRHEQTGEISTRLLLNHLVVIFNVFGNSAFDMLMFKIPNTTYHNLIPFLVLLNRITTEQLNSLRVIPNEKLLKELKEF